jgi:hypothetical protein
VSFSVAQLGVDTGLIGLYRERQQTISEHQQTIVSYLGLHHFGDAEAAQLEKFFFEEYWRLEQTGALKAQALEFLREQQSSNPPSSESFASSASSAPKPASTSSGGSPPKSPSTWLLPLTIYW